MSDFYYPSPEGFEVLSFPVGPLQCNCSIVWDPHTKKAVVVDPGGDFEKIRKALESRELQVQSIVHTHAHFDHINASEPLHHFCQAPLFLHPKDRPLWQNIEMQGKAFGFPLKPIMDFTDELTDEMTFDLGASQKLKTLYTPGHTPGSCSFVIGDILFAGDTLFKGSVGRTDLWEGDFDSLSKSIKNRLYTLDSDTVVITGHGPRTRVGVEKTSNPFVRGQA